MSDALFRARRDSRSGMALVADLTRGNTAPGDGDDPALSIGVIFAVGDGRGPVDCARGPDWKGCLQPRLGWRWLAWYWWIG